jgi:hypothetical protein
MRYILTLLIVAFGFFASAQDSAVVKSSKKPIDKIKVWKDGKVYDADDIEVVCVYNDMESVARFYYRLEDSTGAVVSDGNVEIKGDDYKRLSTLNNWNDRAVVMVMQSLNVKGKEQRAANQAARQAAAATIPKQ